MRVLGAIALCSLSCMLLVFGSSGFSGSKVSASQTFPVTTVAQFRTEGNENATYFLYRPLTGGIYRIDTMVVASQGQITATVNYVDDGGFESVSGTTNTPGQIIPNIPAFHALAGKGMRMGITGNNCPCSYVIYAAVEQIANL